MQGYIYNPEQETLAPEKRREQQGEHLAWQVKRCYEGIPFYKKKMDEAGVKPSDITSIDDIVKLPFTQKTDLRDYYPDGFFCVPPKDVVEIHMSSGTTGKPVVAAYTYDDLELWKECMARTLAMGGVTPDSVVQNGYGYGLFTGGLGVHYGAQKIGCQCIPVGGGNTARQLMIMQDFKSTHITCTPSYALYMAEIAAEMGVDFRELGLQAGFFGAEPWTVEMGDQIEEKLNLLALNIYGLTEIIGPGVSQECEFKQGMHVQEDLFFPEIIDSETGERLPDGQQGELVLTTLTRQATPLLRYRVRDITTLSGGTCQCGRTTVRMARTSGRTDDMLIIRGVNVFPGQIETVLMTIEEVEPHYHIVVDRVNNLDVCEVQVEVGNQYFSDEIRKLEAISKKIAQQLHSSIGISFKVQLVEPKTIARSEGKSKRVTDKRAI